MANDATGSVPGGGVIEDVNALSDTDFAREFGVPVAEAEQAAEGEAEEQETGGEDEAGESRTGDDAEGAEESGSEPGDVEEAVEEDGPEPAEEGDDSAASARKPLAEFRVFDEEGDYDPSVLAALEVEYKANGKVHKDSFDKLVRLAQMGRLNDERVQKYSEVERRAQELEREAQEALERAAEQSRYAIELLEDEDRYMAERERYQQLLTPEARAERAERRLAELEQARHYEAISAEGQAFADKEVVPAFGALLKEFPEVSAEEIYGHFVLLTAKLTGPSGQIPREKFPEVRRLLQGDLRDRVKAQHAARAAKAEKIASPLKRQAVKAKEEATKVKRTLARAVKAPGGGPPKAKSQADRAVVNAEEAVEEIIKGLRF